MRNKWSLEEEKYLTNNWVQADVEFFMKELNRTRDSIVRKAQRMGLDTHKKPSESLKKKWCKEEEMVLIECYHVKPVEELLELLPDRTRDSIIKKAKQLGLNYENRCWTEEEVIYLEEKWGVVCVENIAKKLGRTKNAVLLKAHKIGLREQVIGNGQYLTPKDISSLLSVGIRTVYNWMNRGYIKYKKLKINSMKKYQITVINFRSFLENHKEKWSTRRANINFINSCFKTVPQWLTDKIEADKLKKSQLPRKQWTVKEELSP
jgi:hypothetical protein